MANDELAKSFRKMPPAQLADTIGSLDAAMKRLEAQLELAKAEFKSRNPLNEFTGKLWEVQLSDSSKTTLDTEAGKKKLGARWVTNHSKTTFYQRVLIKERKLSAA